MSSKTIVKNRSFLREKFRFLFKLFLVSVLISANAISQSVDDYDSVPPLISESATPLIMLALSNDHQLFYKAFTDYDDLNGDGVLETTYEHAIEYAGYFDSFKCYSYNTTSGVFIPEHYTSTKYCNDIGNDKWSGNFLNWATMSRIDEVRKVLYGGYRSTDTGAETILERSYLPNDAHSFAKYYNGTDLGLLTPFGNLPTGLTGVKDTGITLCNTTRHTGSLKSQNVTDPPLARVVKGNYSLWAANERYQCLFSGEASVGGGNGNNPSLTGIHAYSSNPGTSAKAQQANGTTIGDYIVRVKACVSFPLIGTEDCKQYPSGNYKPIGLLQQFGEDNSALWGLMTGSYKKNKKGGVLRKNIGSIKDEINVLTNGTFKSMGSDPGIIRSIDALRLVNYEFGSGSKGYYNSADSCSWGMNYFLDGTCTNWGNPFSELMLECYRYFAGKTATDAYDADDSTLLPNLLTESTWRNPQTADTSCARLNVIAFNASTVSYDGDDLAKVSDISPTSSAQELTKVVGDGEGITDNYYFVGESGGNNNQLCTAKQVTDLGLVEGTCPAAPRLDGSYRVAGIAHHARITDLRSDIPNKQKVATYGVSLSPALPKINLTSPSSNKPVFILPACRNEGTSGNPWSGNCGLVDFKIVETPTLSVDGTKVTGSFYVNWEDSEQGGDYDQDMNGVIRFELTSTTIDVTTDVFADSTPYRMGFGFVISGTTEDGFHSISGIEGYSGYGCTSCSTGDAAQTKSFTLGASTVGSSEVGLLEQPLYYASKWGGFHDTNESGDPDIESEWDSKNNVTGALGADGIPDNYFFAVNPKLLKSQLTTILLDILERTASGTSASVVSNMGTGFGALYQALYHPRYTNDSGSKSINWVGTLNALFIDRWGNMREDNATPYGVMTDSDNIVEIYYDDSSKKTLVQRYSLGPDGSKSAAVGAPIEVGDMSPVWSARDELAKVSDYTTQRQNYSDVSSNGRYIITAIDQDADGQILDAASEVFPFSSETFDPSASDNFRLLGLQSSTANESTNIVNFIRGQEGIPGYRSRSIDYDDSGIEKPWLLGDIVHSSPVSVGRPESGFDITYGDETYAEFRKKYQNRRQVVYVGANDGMLHAFNAGFFDAQSATFKESLNGETAHALGSELWAYVPYNLLPHLKWLKDPSYPHVYYVDSTAKTYDVNIFTADDTHPGGWGTILVIGMRFGGGEYTLDPDSDPDGDTGDDITLRSGYVIFDVTDPEQPPTLLAEITDPDMGFTVAEPTLIKAREADSLTGDYSNPLFNKWTLAFGSGPRGDNDVDRATALNRAESSKEALVITFDLNNHYLEKNPTYLANSFVGGLTSVDWTRDYIDDLLYYGTVGGTVEHPEGRLSRGLIYSFAGGPTFVYSFDFLENTYQPFTATPLAYTDVSNDHWIFTGTGRFYISDDGVNADQQSYYGIKEPKYNGLMTFDYVEKSDLIDTTHIQVFTTGDIRSSQTLTSPVTLSNGEDASTFFDLKNEIKSMSGWYLDFQRPRSRNTTHAVISNQSLIFSEYQPSGEKCEPEGNGFLNAPHFQAGVPGPFAPFGTDPTQKHNDGELVELSASIGKGSPSAPVMHQRADGVNAAIVQTSTGQITWQTVNQATVLGQRQSWREVKITW